MRLVFLGNQHMGVVCLRRLLESGEQVTAVVAHPDDNEAPLGPTTVKQLALDFAVPVYQPHNVNAPEFVDQLRQLAPDLLVVVSFRQILKKPVIEVPRLGVVNVHPSLLPKYRGRANLVWAMLHGETKVGVTVHYIDEGIDTGPILVQQEVAIEADDTIRTLLERVTAKYPDALAEAVGRVRQGERGTPQDHSQATYYGKRSRQDGLIDWAASARDIHNLVRAVTRPYPGAFTYFEGRTVRIWETGLSAETTRPTDGAAPGEVAAIIDGAGLLVRTGEGSILIKRMQVDEGPERDALRTASEAGWVPGRRGMRFQSRQVESITS